jgi:hypothetical protein
MTKDEILSMAGQVDAVTKVLLDRKEHQGMNHETFVWFLERFAALVAENEREACARVCEDQKYMILEPLKTYSASAVCDANKRTALYLAKAIRARGKE